MRMWATAPEPKPEPVLREYWCGAWQNQGNHQATTRRSENTKTWRLAAELVLPGDRCKVNICRGVWCLTVRVPHQAIWMRIWPSTSWVSLNNFWWGKCVLQCFWLAWSTKLWWYLEGRHCWCSLSCGSERIPWVVARDGGWTRGTLELWLGLASVADVTVLVVASTDGSR